MQYFYCVWVGVEELILCSITKPIHAVYTQILGLCFAGKKNHYFITSMSRHETVTTNRKTMSVNFSLAHIYKTSGPLQQNKRLSFSLI